MEDRRRLALSIDKTQLPPSRRQVASLPQHLQSHRASRPERQTVRAPIGIRPRGTRRICASPTTYRAPRAETAPRNQSSLATNLEANKPSPLTSVEAEETIRAPAGRNSSSAPASTQSNLPAAPRSPSRIWWGE